MKIALASAEDIPELCELLGSLFTQEAEFVPDRKLQAKGLATVINGSEVGDILVARDDSTIIGMVNLLYTVSTALGERVALLEDMVVSPSARRRGVGSNLVRHAIEFVREKGCRRITLLTDEDNKSAQRFYKRHGFGRSSMVAFRLPLNT